jgi:hypothetical protein
MLDIMPPAGPDFPPTPDAPTSGEAFEVPPGDAPRRRRWILLVVGGVTVLVVVAFAVFAFGIVGASAAGGCGGP